MGIQSLYRERIAGGVERLRRDHWELVSVVPMDGGVTKEYYFKRRKAPDTKMFGPLPEHLRHLIGGEPEDDQS